METRASHMIVGGFVLALLLGLVAFTMWLVRFDLDADYRDYDVFFDSSVFGLYKRSVVYYQGIPVGEVTDIELSKYDPSQVRVELELRGAVPVVEGSTASLEFQGLTGVAYIELKGGPRGAPQIVAEAGEERPVIPSETSGFQALFQGAPDLLNETVKVVGQLQKLLSDENVGKLSATIENVADLSSNLAGGTEDLATIAASLRTTLDEVSVAANRMSKLAETSEDVLDTEARALLANTAETMRSATALITRVDALVAANEDNVTQFTSASLPELTRMITDLRAASRNMSRLVGRLEKNPVDVLLGPGEPEYDLKSRKREGGDN